MKSALLYKMFNSDEHALLAHYTNFESAIKIVSSGKMRYNAFSAMNDISESALPFFFSSIKSISSIEDIIDDVKSEIGQYYMISFCQDGMYRCFAIPSMWGHYGDKGRGACLVFDKKKIESIALNNNGIPLPILYTNELSPITFDSLNSPTIKSEVNKNIGEWFCHKTKDWTSEQEFRVIRKFERDSINSLHLNVGKALKCIIICKDESLEPGASARGGLKYNIMKAIAPKRVPVLVFENQLLSRKWGLFDGRGESMIWAE